MFRRDPVETAYPALNLQIFLLAIVIQTIGDESVKFAQQILFDELKEVFARIFG